MQGVMYEDLLPGAISGYDFVVVERSVGTERTATGLAQAANILNVEGVELILQHATTTEPVQDQVAAYASHLPKEFYEARVRVLGPKAKEFIEQLELHGFKTFPAKVFKVSGSVLTLDDDLELAVDEDESPESDEDSEA